jgi:hypothetical protein
MKTIIALILAATIMASCTKTVEVVQPVTTQATNDSVFFFKYNYIDSLTLTQSDFSGWLVATWVTVGVSPDSYAYKIDGRGYEPGSFTSGVSIGQLDPGIHQISIKAFYGDRTYVIINSINLK